MKKIFVIPKKDVVIKILRDMTQLENQPVRNQPEVSANGIATRQRKNDIKINW